MNLEPPSQSYGVSGQRQRLMESVHRLERLLDFAERTGDEPEVERLHKELMALVEECGDGSCVRCGG